MSGNDLNVHYVVTPRYARLGKQAVSVKLIFYGKQYIKGGRSYDRTTRTGPGGSGNLSRTLLGWKRESAEDARLSGDRDLNCKTY